MCTSSSQGTFRSLYLTRANGSYVYVDFYLFFRFVTKGDLFRQRVVRFMVISQVRHRSSNRSNRLGTVFVLSRVVLFRGLLRVSQLSNYHVNTTIVNQVRAIQVKITMAPRPWPYHVVVSSLTFLGGMLIDQRGVFHCVRRVHLGIFSINYQIRQRTSTTVLTRLMFTIRSRNQVVVNQRLVLYHLSDRFFKSNVNYILHHLHL